MVVDQNQIKGRLEEVLHQHEYRIQSHMMEDQKKSKLDYEILFEKKNHQLFLKVKNKLGFQPETLNRLYFSFSSAIESEKKQFREKVYRQMRAIGIENFRKYLLNSGPSNLTPDLYIYAYYSLIHRFLSKKITGWKIV